MNLEEYLRQKLKEEKLDGIEFTDEQISGFIEKRINATTVEEAKLQIDELVKKEAAALREELHLLEKFESVDEIKNIEDLEGIINGLTLNIQDIDLLKIVTAKTPEDLIGITQIKILDEPSTLLTEERKREIFAQYLESLHTRIEEVQNPNLKMSLQLQNLINSGELPEELGNDIREILQSNTEKKKEAIFSLISKSEKYENIMQVLRDFEPIEKDGIKSTSYDAFVELAKRINEKYESITIDEETKYGNFVRPSFTIENGELISSQSTYLYDRFDKALDYVQSINKKARLNTILFYMDCPEELYQLPISENNRTMVKEELRKYVEAVANHINEAGYTDTVRSIDAFNELLNRYPYTKENPYLYRGDIEQPEKDDDNIKSGWLKHLNLEDLCDVVASAKRILPNIDFMYNDDNLVDPKKIPATIEILDKIRDYESKNGIQILDSIGTQMHLSDSCTKEQITEMVRALAKYNLPIEITEFDIAMVDASRKYTPYDIELIRQKKINELYEVVEELKEECNIRGFTIWSKTDSQNFRVDLANRELAQDGKPLISTLHGGIFTKDMVPKSEAYKHALIKNNVQSFNYHTHTKRCGHAGIEDEQAYINEARKNNINQLGFSDHVPFHELEYTDSKNRMHISEVDDYIAKVRELQEKNPDMLINVGFEAEYETMKSGFLSELRDKVDYMILGQHFTKNGIETIMKENNPDYPTKYAEVICEGIESGIFDIVAHPDIFMQELSTIKTEEGKKAFIENAKLASRKICDAAASMGIPVELNLAGVQKENSGYPNPLFWEIASDTKVQVLYGADAHTPEQIKHMEYSKHKTDELIGKKELNFVSKDYNPVEARKKNKKLNEAYEQTKAKSTSYETNLTHELIKATFERKEDIPITEETTDKAKSQLRKFQERDKQYKAKEEEKLREHTEEKVEKAKDKPAEAEFYKKREETTKVHLSETQIKRTEMVNRTIENLDKAKDQGAKTSKEAITKVTQMTETSKQQQRAPQQGIDKRTPEVEKRASELREKHQQIKSKKQELKKENVKKLEYKPPKPETNKGQTNMFEIVIIIGALLTLLLVIINITSN